MKNWGVWGLCSLALIGAWGCSDEWVSSSNQVTLHAGATIAEQLAAASSQLLAEIEAVGQRCTSSHGHWRRLLHSCRCPAHTVFLVDRGCQRPRSPAFAGLIALQRAMEAPNPQNLLTAMQPYEMQEDFNKPAILFHLDDWSHFLNMYFDANDTIDNLKQQFEADATRLVNDISFSLNHQSATAQDILSPGWVAQKKLMDYHSFGATALESFYKPTYVDIKKPQKHLYAAVPTATLCEEKLQTLLQPYPPNVAAQWFSQPLSSFCQDLTTAMHRVVQEDQAAWQDKPFLARSYKPHCRGNCTFNVTFEVGSHRFSYDVAMHDYVGVQRRLMVKMTSVNEMVMLLTPSGDILQIVFDFLATNKAPAALTYRTVHMIVDGNFSLLTAKNTVLGDVARLQASAEIGITPQSLANDAQKHTTYRPVAAAVWDDVFTLGNAEFNRRLALHPQAHWQLVHYADVSRNLFTNEAWPLANYALNRLPTRQLYTNPERMNWIDWQYHHGNSVASVLMNDLPNIKVDLIGEYDYSMGFDHPEWSALNMCERLRRQQVRVLVLAWGLDQFLLPCAQFLTTLARACDKVLIIASSGNLDAEMFGASCPDSLERYIDNFVSVAGVDASGHRLRKSVYSKQLIALAAPQKMPCLEPDFSLGTCPGTSYSAPAVGNAALHLFARRPELTPQQAIGLLKKHCFKDRLPLGCGGGVNFDEFFAAEVAPYPNQ